jgi:hypothetical protein
VPIHVVAPVSDPAPTMLRMTSLADGTLLLFVNPDDTGVQVRIESSADLLEWQPVGMVGPALETPVIKPPQLAPAGSARFYRALSVPR